MSEIHLDQDGEHNEPHERCTEIRWRVFSNPGSRGAPRIVHDRRNGGAPLYTGSAPSYLEFRDSVDGQPGYYRGDQVDENRRVIPDAKPFYVTITAEPRNAAQGGTSDDLVKHLVDSNTRQSETLINQLGNIMREQRKTMRETRKMMRVVATADLRELFKQYAAAVEKHDDEDEEDEDDDELEEAPGDVWGDIKDMFGQVSAAIEAWMLDRQAQRAASPPSASTPAAPPPPPAAPPPSPAATISTAAAPPPPIAAPPPAPASSTPAAPAPISETSATAPSAPLPDTTPAEVRNAASASAMPTPVQAAHLMAILHALQPSERTIARAVVHRMNAEQRAHWLGQLSALSVEKAVELVRSMIPDRTKKESES